MGSFIKGEKVTLYDKVKTGVDSFNKPIMTEVPIEVDNILIAPINSSEIVNINDLEGTKVVYELAIPKGDSHNWSKGHRVDFWGQSFRTVGIPIMGINENIPLDWNLKVRVEHYE